MNQQYLALVDFDFRGYPIKQWSVVSLSEYAAAPLLGQGKIQPRGKGRPTPLSRDCAPCAKIRAAVKALVGK